MPHTSRLRILRSRLLASCMAVATVLGASNATAGSVSKTMPDTEAGAIGAAMIAHINSDTPDGIRTWAPSILSPSIDAEMRAALVKQLAVAVSDSGGVDFVDARTQGPPGMLVVTIKGRRSGQLAALVLLPDAEQPGKLAMADLVPLDDPALFDSWPETGATQDDIVRLARAALDHFESANEFSGCLSISDGSKTFFDECRGLAERRFAVPVDRDTRFHIGSINKMFTAVAIAQLVESGKLSWDSRLSALVPEYPDRAAAEKITVWQLLHHTAGLGDFIVPELFAQREKFVAPADYLDLIARQPKVGEPGEDWSYSNAGFLLLGRIVENLSGQSYPDYIRDHVFDPAGMTASGYDRVDEIVPNLAVGYFREGAFAKDWKADWLKVPYSASPAGGGYSTSTDLLRFSASLRDGKLLKAETLARMFADGVPVGPGTYAAGFGERVSHGRHIRGHAGGIEGTDANLAIVWETGASVALTSNQGPGQYWLFSERIADLLAGQGQKP